MINEMIRWINDDLIDEDEHIILSWEFVWEKKSQKERIAMKEHLIQFVVRKKKEEK